MNKRINFYILLNASWEVRFTSELSLPPSSPLPKLFGPLASGSAFFFFWVGGESIRGFNPRRMLFFLLFDQARV